MIMLESSNENLHQDAEIGATEQPKGSKLSLKVHEVAKDCQNRNGLRHGDYHQYRQYCTRRLRRVRSSRQVRLMFGKGKVFVQKELTPDIVTTSSHLEIPLMAAERAWAYAMQRKQETVDAPYGERRHAVTRLAKAAKWAADLEALCLETADDRTCLEAIAYSAWMSGNLLVEKGAWREALGRYSIAHHICQELGKVGNIEDQDLFSRRVEEIEPTLRYCRYNLAKMNGSASEELAKTGREDSSAGGDLLAAKLESVVAQARATQDSEVGSVNWRGKKVSVRSEDLRDKLAKADGLAQRLRRDSAGGAEQGKAVVASLSPEQCQNISGAYDDALSLISKEASRIRGKGSGVKVEARRAELEALRSYAQHHKLTLMQQRNEHLVQQLQEKWRKGTRGRGVEKQDPVGVVADIIHVYDALLQGVRNMVINLGGGDGDDDDVAEEEDELVENARADEARFRAFRCYFMIEAFLAQGKWAQASTLFGHTRGLCQEAADQLEDGPRAESLARLDEMVQGVWHRAAAHALLIKSRKEADLSAGIERITISGSGGTVDRGSAYLPLQERLREFDPAEGGAGAGAGKTKVYRIADFPPQIQLLPCKPRLLDLAFDEMEFPDLDERAGIEKKRKEAEAAASSQKAGISGWVGWAFGR